MRPNRRDILRAAGGLTLLAVAGGVWRGVGGSGSSAAYAPWDDWRAGMHEGPLALVRAAILAASVHNSQPWRFRVFPGSIDVFADPARTAGVLDPFRREAYLSLGCAIENMVVAAPSAGFLGRVTLTAGRLDAGAGGTAPVATIQLDPRSGSPDPLASAIAERHTNRGPYDTDRPLPPEILSGIASLASGSDGIRLALFTDPEQRAAFALEIARSAEAVLADEPVLVAQERWLRRGSVEINASRDGMPADDQGASGLGAGIMEILPDLRSHARYRRMLDELNDVQLPASPAFGLLSVQDPYDISQTLEAGRFWQRLHLWASARGLALQPMNAVLARVDREKARGLPAETARRLAGFVGDPAWTPTFAFRAGYPLHSGRPGPRRPVESALMPSDAATYTPA